MTAHLHRRDDGAVELRVNGVFVMDDRETTSEERLAEVALDAGARELLVGGLGLGFTTRRLLADESVERVLVIESEPAVIAAVEVDDPRATVVEDRLQEAMRDQADSSWDAILLDVDNGPDFLVHEANACLYGAEFIGQCRRVLRGGGILAVWSMSRSGELETALEQHFANVSTEAIPVTLQGRDESYFIHIARP